VAGKERPLTVVRSPVFLRKLGEIWEWNANAYSQDWADRYLSFLNAQVQKIATNPEIGAQAEVLIGRRYLICKVKAGGDGHIIVYRWMEADGQVVISNIYHTKQNRAE
jgi:plasmid stabilization system protein ParE